MLNSKIKFIGVVTIHRYDESTGVSLEKRVIPNLVVNSGLEWIASRMTGVLDHMSHMAIGYSATPPVKEDLSLYTEGARVSLSNTYSLGNKSVYIAVFPAGVGTGLLKEAGIFNSPTVGTLLARTVFPEMNKGATDGISITWEISGN